MDTYMKQCQPTTATTKLLLFYYCRFLWWLTGSRASQEKAIILIRTPKEVENMSHGDITLHTQLRDILKMVPKCTSWLKRILCPQLLQSCLTLCDPMDCRPPGSSVHGILQTRTLAWVAMPSSRRSSLPRDQTWVSKVSRTGWQILYH